MRNTMITFALVGVFGAQPAIAAQPTLEEKLDILQQEIEVLKGRTAGNSVPAQGAAASADGHGYHGGSGSTTVGGYGEAVYNNYRNGGKKDEADLKRFIIFLGHKFSDRLRFFSELEVEHAKVDNNGGAVEMEQAYIEYGLTNKMNTRIGLMIMPLGITNETHEPTTFYGVERNEVESRIIPSTWRELGVALQGQAAAGLEYNVGVSTTPDASRHKDKDASEGFRELRTNGRQAAANDLGVFAALNYRGVPGLLLGGAVFSGDTAQDGEGATPTKSDLVGASANLTLWDVHAKYAVGNLDLQALYARGTLSDTDKINAAAGLALGSDKAAPKSFYGWYGQAAYHVWQQGDLDVAPFVRYERYNTQASVAAGYTVDPKNSETVTTLGVNFKLHPQVVLKADYQNYQTDNLKDRINLGMGYMF